jgi:GAF domain-containing protein/HAMP domain-containing protein
MTVASNPQPGQPEARRGSGRSGAGHHRGGASIRRRLLALALGLTVLPLVVVFATALPASGNIIRQAQEISVSSLRAQAEDYLVQINASIAGQNAMILDRAARDVLSVAYTSGALFGGEIDMPETTVGMTVGPERQLMNSARDVSSVFVPNVTWMATDYNPELYQAITRDIELSSYLDLTMPAIQENNPDAAAIYLGTAHDVLRYYPNIRLGEVVPPDFQVTQRPWYLASLEGNRAGKTPQPVWSQVYADATGLGLVTTVAIPVYTGAGELIGVAGLDVTLNEIQKNIEAARFLETGYSFLIDEGGNALILTEQGYRDLLRREPDPEQPIPNLPQEADDPALQALLQRMMAGESGFTTLTLEGKEFYVSFTPLRAASGGEATTPGWSLASVVAAGDVLANVAGLEQQLEQTIRQVVTRRVLPVAVIAALALAVMAWMSTSRLVNPILKLSTAAEQLGSGDWETPVPALRAVEAGSDDEIGLLAGTLRGMAGQLRQTFGQLEQRVAERTQALEYRNLQMQTAAEVAREITTAQDLDELLHGAVNLISERFGYYNVGIFLVDETSEFAMLKAASGDLGRRLLEREIRLRVGQQGMVGYVTRFGQPRRANDVTAEGLYLAEELLAHTGSELTLPLRSGPKIIGALDVQSEQKHRFSDEDVTILQALADQLATAIENVRLVSHVRLTLEETNLLIQRQARENWSKLRRRTGLLGYEYDRMEVRPLAEAADSRGESRVIRVPVRLRGQVIGVIGLEAEDPEHAWTPDELAIIEATAGQAAITVENARLLADSRRQAAREQITAEVTARLRASLDMQTVLKAAVSEIAEKLGIAEVAVELSAPQEAQPVAGIDDPGAAEPPPSPMAAPGPAAGRNGRNHDGAA